MALADEDSSLILSLSALQATDTATQGASDPLPHGASIRVGLLILKAEALAGARHGAGKESVTRVLLVKNLLYRLPCRGCGARCSGSVYIFMRGSKEI